MKKNFFQRSFSTNNNVFNRGDSEKTCLEVMQRISNPDYEDILAINRLHNFSPPIEINSKTELNEEELENIRLASEDISLFNLNYLGYGLQPDVTFSMSKHLTYCLECPNGLEETKNMFKKTEHIKCAFIDHMKTNLIVILGLDHPINHHYIYKLIFDLVANYLMMLYPVRVLNLDDPFAFFYFSNDSNPYLNRYAEAIPVADIVKSLNEF